MVTNEGTGLMKGRFQGAAVTGTVAALVFGTLYSFMRRQFEKEHKEDQDMVFDLLDEVWEYRSQQEKPAAAPKKAGAAGRCPYCGSAFENRQG